MNKTDFVAAVAEKAGLSKKDAAASVDAFLGVVKDELKAGGDVTFVGFGKFFVKDVPAREARNPQTGKKMKLKAHKAPGFKFGQTMKDEIR